jgi:uncharacterized membrane protein
MAQPEGQQSKRSISAKVSLLVILAVVLVVWLINTPPGLLGKADAIGYAVCHRIAVRSFFLGERQLPLCARCTGMYLGAMLGLTFQQVIGRRRSGMPAWPVLLVVVLFFFAFIVDGGNSFLSIIPQAPHLYPPNNTLRLFTGTGVGLAIAILLYPAFNSTVWREQDSRPAISGFLALLGLIGLAILLDLIVLLRNPLILYPLALISAAGVVILLTMVYTMLWLAILKSENRYNQPKELLFPVLAGLLIALIQLAVFDLLRFWMTGTWEGFHLG